MAEIRLSKILKHYNIGLRELVTFLRTNGVDIVDNPNAKISDEYLDKIEAVYGRSDEQYDTPIHESNENISAAFGNGTLSSSAPQTDSISELKITDIKTATNSFGHSSETCSFIKANDKFVINPFCKWEIGAIIYFDGNVNFKGMIAVKARHHTTYRFYGDSIINEQKLNRGDLVVFTHQDSEVKEVFALRCVANFPWPAILKHVDFYKNIEFDVFLDRERTISKHIAIPVIQECLRIHNNTDEDNLWLSFFKRIQSYETDDLKNTYITEVLPYGIRELFIEKCINSGYISQLMANNDRLVSQYAYLVSYILSSAIEDEDLTIAVQILSYSNLTDAYDSFICAFNKLDNDWSKQKEIILSSVTSDGNGDFFASLLSTDTNVRLSSRSLFTLAIIKSEDIYFDAITDDFGDNIRLWIQTIPKDDIPSISTYLYRCPSSLVNDFISDITERDYAQEILLANINEEETVIERILLDVQTANGEPDLSALLLVLTSDSIPTVFRSFPNYPNRNKRVVIEDLLNTRLNIDLLISPISENQSSVLDLLSSDSLFTTLGECFDPTILSGTYWQFKHLLDLGLITDIPRSVISRCIGDETDLEKATAILSEIGAEMAESILEEDFPGAPIHLAHLEKLWQEASILNYACIDLESDKIHISEAVALRGSIIKTSYEEQTMGDVISFISSADIIIGHNIKEFDLPILFEHGLIEHSSQNVWDTYEIEMALEPTRFSYALETSHSAVEDAKLCEMLFWNQLYRICFSDRRYDHIIALLPEKVRILIERIRLPKFQSIFSNNAYQDITFFRERNALTITLVNKLKAIPENSLIIAPEDLWPEIALCVNANFPSANGIQYSSISRAAINEWQDTQSIPWAILKTFVDTQDNPLVVKLSRAVRVLIRDNQLMSFIEESPRSASIICTDSFGVDKLGDLNSIGVNGIYVTGYEIESRINRVAISDPFCAADLLRSDYGSRLVMQLSGASYTPISKDDCKSLDISDIPSDAKNIWMQKDEKGQYQVFCNRIFSQYLADIHSRYPSIKHHGIDWKFSDSAESKIAIVSTKNQNRFDARIKRVNSASQYRSMYWVYQIALLEGINTPLVKVLYIGNSREIPSLTRYAESKGYYIPESSASIQRRIELCQEHSSSKKMIIIGPEGFNLLRQTKVKYPYCLFWDNLDTDCLQVMWRGMLPFGNEPEYGAEVDNRKDNDDKKDIPPALSCILGMWPMVKYYCHQIALQDESNEVCLLDPSFDDYKELEKSFLAKRLEVELWLNDESYKSDLQFANQFFSGRRCEDINLNVDEVMNTIWQVFVAPKLKGTSEGWSDIQRKALPVILGRETNTLVSIPTGGGKSVLFQGSALYRSAYTNRLSVVVTPLKALMQDQVEGLHDLGFVTNVEYLNSDKTRPETNRIYRKISGGEIALLYITPERFRSRGFRNALESRMQVDAGLEYIIFDEAHCISQWGLDFRPEYLSAAQECSKIVNIYPETRIELFSATVTGQVQRDIESIITPINVISSEASYNPIRNHIGMQFVSDVKDSIEDRINVLYSKISASEFDPSKSRILVFCRRKRDTEESCELLKTKLESSSNTVLASIAGKIGYFHAGMDTDDRAYVFSQYKSGEFSILFATKAFGMGMDIPNIHYVYHLYPPQFVEDYLQEVGRAGRSKELYQNAGFNPENPIPTYCFVSREDFQNLKTLLAQSMLSWVNIRSIYKSVKEFVGKFQSNGDKKIPIAVPDTLWKKDISNGASTDPTAFRLGLYWLERMKRVEMGYYASTTLDITLPRSLKPLSIVTENKLRLVYEYILNTAGEDCSGKSIQIYINDICSSLSIGQYTLFQRIIQGVKLGLFSIATKTPFDLTKIRSEEIKYCSRDGRYYVFDVIFKATEELLSTIRLREASRIDIQKRNSILNAAVASVGIPQNQYMPWHTAHSVGLSKSKSYIQDIIFKRAKYIFDIIDMLPGASIKTTFDTGSKQVIQEVYLSSNKWRQALEELKNNALLLLDTLIKRHKSNHKDFIWADTIAKLNLPDSYQYFCNLISILRGIGFIKAESILSTGIEITLTDNIEDLPGLPKEGLDREVYNDFVRVNHLKDIKFALMNAFSKVGHSDFDTFIKEYFRCETEKDYMDLLGLIVDEHDPIWLGLQAEAIKAQEDRLDEQQRAIYDAPIDKDINVLAGPGSGKTHVLTLRCARLVYHEHILPQNILVLAYNRAVVEELKTRLAKLFGELGFGRAMNRLQIYTFHGLAKRYCHNIQDLPVEQWELAFLNYVKANPGEFLAEMGNVQFILIDEFQDITQVRLDLMIELKRILSTSVSTPRFFTIGDINQSIYGFERRNMGQPLAPEYYYQQLNDKIHPETMHMSFNYRSYQGILDAAFRFVPDTPTQFKPTSAPSFSEPSFQYVFIKDVIRQNGQQIGQTWHEEFPQIFQKMVNYNSSLSNDEKSTKRVKTLAIFFRNNNEVYRGYARIRQMNLPNANIRVQGTASEFYKTRECNYVIRALRLTPDEKVSSEMKSIMLNYINKIKHDYSQWNTYYLDLTYALVLEFMDSYSDEACLYSDVAEFIEDMGAKDDGQLSKIYQKYNQSRTDGDDSIDIILTTMHKVKGLEFDAVVVTPSYQHVGYRYDSNLKNWVPDSEYLDELSEERRLYFVAYSRAKRFLYAYRHPREISIEYGRRYAPSQALLNRIGISFDQGIDKLYINYTAIDSNYHVNNFIQNHLKKDALVTLHRSGSEWYIMSEGTTIGRLRRSACYQLNQRAAAYTDLRGLFVNDIIVWQYDDTLRSDAKNNTNYASDWSHVAKQQKYIYLVDVAGYIEI